MSEVGPTQAAAGSAATEPSMFQDRSRSREASTDDQENETEPSEKEKAEIEGAERGTSARIAGDFKADLSRRRQEERRQLQEEKEQGLGGHIDFLG